MNEQYGYAPPLALSSEKADLLDKIQPTLIVDLIEHNLLNEVEINGKWEKADWAKGHNSFTKFGAHEIKTLMLPVSSQNVSLSKLKDSEIRARALSIAKTNQEMCLRNWKEFGIKSPDQLSLAHELVFSNTFITLKQPEGEGIRKLLKDTMTAEISPEPEELKGWGNIFKRR